MNETVCFRCDWQGRARTRTCPSCGAPLYRPDREDVARDPDAFDLDEARVGEVASRRPGPRGRSVAIAVAVAIATVGSIQLFAAASETARHAGTRRRRSLRRDRLRRRRRGRWLDPVDGRPARGDGAPRPVDPDRDVGARRPVRRRSGMDRCRTTGSRSDGRRRRARHLRRRRHRPARERRSHRVGTGWQEPGLRPQRTDRTRRAARRCRIRLVTVLTEKVEWALDDPGFCGPMLSLSRSAGRDVLQRRLGRSAERVPDRHGRRPASDVRRRGHALRRRRRRRSCFDPMPPHGPRAVPRERPARCSGGRGSAAR